MDEVIICPQCGKALKEGTRFCPFCGCRIEIVVDTEKIPEDKGREKLIGGIRSRFRLVGSKAQEVSAKAQGMLTQEKTTDVISKAKDLSKKATGMVSSDRASDVVKNMVNLIIQVAKDIKKEIPPEMIKAIDIEAEMSFIAFSIGISVDLEQLET